MHSGGSRRPASPASSTSDTNPENPCRLNPSHGTADIDPHSDASSADEHSAQPSGLSNLTTSSTSHSGTTADHNQHSESNDTPRWTISPETRNYFRAFKSASNPALHPRADNADDSPDHDMQDQDPNEGGTSPARSQRSAESSRSTSPSSSSESASSYQRPHNPTPQCTHNPSPIRHSYPQHYPAYHGEHRHGLEHVRHRELLSHTGRPYYRTPPQGYPMDGISSPEIVEDGGTRVNMPSHMNYPVRSSQGSSSSSIVSTADQPPRPNVSTFNLSSPTDSSRSCFPDAGPYLRQQLGLSAHDPINLRSLPDPSAGEKPLTPLPTLIKLAIYGSPNKRLTLQEIYTELEKRFQWFRDHKHEKAWKNSIRHNLSLNKVFRHVPRPITEPGKGSYWQLDVSGGEGYKRPRKRRPKNRIITSEEDDEEVSDMDDDRRPSSSDTTGRSSATPADNAMIDPGLRGEGHVVGGGRMRCTTRRAGGSPYPPQSSRYQQGSPPVVARQDASALGESPVRFDEPSFGQTSFPTFPQARQMPMATSSVSFAALSSSTVRMAPIPSSAVRLPSREMPPYDRFMRIPNMLPPRPGIEYVVTPGGLPYARRTRPSPEAQEHFQESRSRSSSESSSGSSRTRGGDPERKDDERSGRSHSPRESTP